MSERSIAPGPKRLASAWQAGLRPGALWWRVGAWCLAVAAAAELGGPVLAAQWRTSFADSVRGAAPTEGLLAWGLILAVGLALAWLVPLVLGNVGPVTDARDPSLPSALRTPGPVITAVAAIALVGLAGLAGPVVAGAARAPDASQAALVTLWARWVTGLSGAVGVLLLLAGVAEHLIMRRSLWQDLHMTSDQARDRARRHGGTRG